MSQEAIDSNAKGSEQTQNITDQETDLVDYQNAAKRLLEVLSNDSSSARTSWIFFIAIMAYFFVAIAGVTHKNLLLNSPVELPFLGIGIEVTSFFTFAPLIFVLIHFGLVIQHVLLAQKVHHLNEILAGPGDDRSRFREQILFELHSYFFTQLIAGYLKNNFLRFLLQSMSSLSFVIIPAIILLYFQIAFLPYHDNWITAYHRIYLTIDLLIVFVLLTYISPTYATSGIQSIVSKFRQFLLISFRTVFVLLVLSFAYGVATVPDGLLDRKMTAISSVELPIQQPQSRVCRSFLSEQFCTSMFGALRLEQSQSGFVRKSFVVTAYLFEGLVDLANGDSESLFNRNLIVADQNLVKETPTPIDATNSQSNFSFSLRGRDLRYATLDRSNLRRVDFTGATLVGASLRGTNLQNAKLSCARAPRSEVRILGGQFEQCSDLKRARLEGANLVGANLTGAIFDEADFTDAQLRNADLTKVSAIDADFSFANLSDALLIESNLTGARLLEANLQGAQMRFANLQFANFLKSNLQGANLSLAKAEAASFRLANLNGSRLRLTWLQGSDFQGARLQAAVLRNAILHVADLRSARLEGADLSFARLQYADFSGSEIQGADFRRTMMWYTQPPQPLKFPKHLVDLRGVRTRPPNLQDQAAVTAILTRDSQHAVGRLDRTTRGKLSKFMSSSTGSWTFQSEFWTLPQGRSVGSLNQFPPNSAETEIQLDPKAKNRGQFFANLACGDGNANGYLAQGVIRRVLRAKVQIDVSQFCRAMKAMPLEQCTVRTILHKNLPERIRRILNQEPDCSFGNQ